MTAVDEPIGPADVLPVPVRPPTGMLAWLTSTDHKRIGLSYMVTAFVFFLVGGSLAMVMRAQLAQPEQDLVSNDTYNQLFTMHGSIMLFLFIGPFAFGLANYLIPLQVGARDMAFPRLNAFSYWLYLGGGITMVSGFATAGGAAAFGWFGYTPLSDPVHSPGLGGDLWLAGLVLTGFSGILTAVNILTTVFCLRMPTMNAFRMPIFTWDMVVTSVLVLLAFPVLTAAGALLFIDRHLDGHVFDLAGGGVPILWQHLFWFFGHPEVYIVVLPYFGVITEIIPVFARRPLFGYAGLVFATIAIAALSVGVWAHHMFVTGAVLLPVLLRALVPDRGADGDQVRQLDRVHVGRADPLLRAHAVLGRLPRPVPARRAHRRDAGLAAARLPGERHLLRRGALPLHAGRRVGVRRVRGASTSGSRSSPAGCSTSGWPRPTSGCSSSAST